MVGTNPDKRPILAMKLDGCVVGITLTDIIHTPKLGVSCERGTWDIHKAGLILVQDEVGCNQCEDD